MKVAFPSLIDSLGVDKAEETKTPSLYKLTVPTVELPVEFITSGYVYVLFEFRVPFKNRFVGLSIFAIDKVCVVDVFHWLAESLA